MVVVNGVRMQLNICAAEMKTKESELKKAIHLKEIMHKSILQQKVPYYTYLRTPSGYTYILNYSICQLCFTAVDAIVGPPSACIAITSYICTILKSATHPST